jgi:hypothetical protein
MPRRRIREIGVVLKSPNFVAALSQPPSTPFVARRVATIWSVAA